LRVVGADNSPLQQLFDHRLLLLQLVDGDVNLGAAEVIDREALRDFQLVPVAVPGESADESGRNACPEKTSES
jgi:hypothetical protein